MARQGSVRPAFGALPDTALVFGVSLACVIFDAGALAADAKRVAALLVAILALALRFNSLRRAPLRLGAGSVAWLGFVALSALSLLWGPASGWLELAPWVASAGLLLAASSFDRARARRLALESAFLTGSTTAAIALVQFASGARGILVHGGQGNGNWLGLLLAVTLPLSARVVRDELRSNRWIGLLLAILVAGQAAALVLSQSRTAWIALLVGAIVALTLQARRRTALLAAAGLCAALLACAAESLPVAPAPRSDGAQASSEVAGAWHGRVWIWRASLSATRDSLPFGAGLGGFGHAYLHAQARYLAPLDAPEASRRFENATTAHNDWIQAAAESGPIATLLLAIALLASAGALHRAGMTAGAASLVALAVAALGDSPLRQPAIVMLLALLFASTPGSHRRWLPSRALAAAVLVGASWLLARATGYWLADRAEWQAASAGPQRQLLLLEKATSISPTSGTAWLELGLARLDRGDAQAAIDAFARSRELLANVGTDVAMGNAHLELGRPELAYADYVRAIALHPGAFRPRANIVEALRRLERFDEARTHLRIARSLYPGHPRLEELAERLRQSEAGSAD